MKAKRKLILVPFLSLVLPAGLQAADVLEPAATIALPSVKGRIDHFGVDLKQRRLFIAALGNDTLEVVDVRSGRRERSLDGFGEPQGVLYLPEFNRIYVANGSANRVDILDGTSLARIKSVERLDDADNVRYDAGARKVYVGYGRGALRALDPTTGDSAGDIRLAGHPESFQLETRGTRIFVNVPAARHVAVVDRKKRAVVATWGVPGAESNYPMALDESGRRIRIVTRWKARSARLPARAPGSSFPKKDGSTWPRRQLEHPPRSCSLIGFVEGRPGMLGNRSTSRGRTAPHLIRRPIMKYKECRYFHVFPLIAAFVVAGSLGWQPARAEGDSKELQAVAQALGKSKLSLLAGIRQASQGSAKAISAKFELEDGKLSLSVYTAE